MHRAGAVLALVLWAGTAAAQQDASLSQSLAARVAAGDSAWAREDHPAALAAYTAVLRADSSFSSRAVFRAGLLNAWRNRFSPALSALRLYVRLEPSDLEGRIVLARTYAWASRFPEALAQYDTLLAVDADHREAVIGRATTLAWADRIPEAEAVMHTWLRAHPDDAGAWVQLAQYRRWRGTPYAAAEALERALALSPDLADAQEQLQWVRADIRPAALTTVVMAEDSEQNAFTLTEVGVTFFTRRHVRGTVMARNRWVGVGASQQTTVPGAHAQALWQPAGRSWTLRADVGVVSYDVAASTERSVQGRGGLRAAGRLGPKMRVGAGVGREPFDEVFSMATRAMMFGVADADVSYQLLPKLALGLAASRGEVSGVAIENARTTGMAALRITPRPGVSLALTQREVSWDEPAYGIFFAPQRWTISEASVGWARTAELGLVLGGDVAVGSQGVGFEDGPLDRSTAPRAAMRIGWRAEPGREIVAALVYANVAGAGTITASDYRYGALTLTGRWTF